MLLRVDEIGAEIEPLFGHVPNDLALDVSCNTMLRNVKYLIATAPISALSCRLSVNIKNSKKQI